MPSQLRVVLAMAVWIKNATQHMRCPSESAALEVREDASLQGPSKVIMLKYTTFVPSDAVSKAIPGHTKVLLEAK